jgi:protein-disulfide isomerase
MQGRFWEMHDRLFESPINLGEARLKADARILGLNAEKFETCLNGEATARVREDLASAKELGVTGTPSFFFGRLKSDGLVSVTARLTGAQPVEEFIRVIEQVLK